MENEGYQVYRWGAETKMTSPLPLAEIICMCMFILSSCKSQKGPCAQTCSISSECHFILIFNVQIFIYPPCRFGTSSHPCITIPEKELTFSSSPIPWRCIVFRVNKLHMGSFIPSGPDDIKWHINQSYIHTRLYFESVVKLCCLHWIVSSQIGNPRQP